MLMPGPAEVLAVVAVEVKVILGLLVQIANPIVKFALCLVADVTGGLLEIVAKITACTGLISSITRELFIILGPVLALIH